MTPPQALLLVGNSGLEKKSHVNRDKGSPSSRPACLPFCLEFWAGPEGLGHLSFRKARNITRIPPSELTSGYLYLQPGHGAVDSANSCLWSDRLAAARSSCKQSGLLLRNLNYVTKLQSPDDLLYIPTMVTCFKFLNSNPAASPL